MTRFAAALTLSLAAATQASAFSIDLTLPNLTFPPTTTTVSAQNAAQPGK